ncbi:MAG: Ku protein [Bryobacterales bacterium]|nr:Ku protein [Bryobacterales bacterium]
MASTIWKGHITFGLVSLPVRLTAAARAETVSFNQLHKTDNSRVKQVLYCQAEDVPVSRAELVKGYEYEKGRYVVIDEEDIKKITPKSAKVMEIIEFVKADEMDALYLESSYYLQPDEAGEKAYTLLFEAMKRTGHVGIAKMTMHNREHVVVLRPGRHGMVLHTMYYQDEVRAIDEFRTNSGLVQDRELMMATSLVEALSAPFDVTKYRDTYRETLRSMIEAKIQGQEVVAAPEQQELAPVIDIMEALKSSLNALKKPATTETKAEQLQLDVVEAPKKKRASGGRRAG